MGYTNFVFSGFQGLKVLYYKGIGVNYGKVTEKN